MPEPRPRTPA
jgi:hypothetical protein